MVIISSRIMARTWLWADLFRSQLPDFNGPINEQSLAPAWREMLNVTIVGDTSIRDRDLKVLAWLEYAEMLAEGMSCNSYPLFNPPLILT
jgi:hypothetical protein